MAVTPSPAAYLVVFRFGSALRKSLGLASVILGHLRPTRRGLLGRSRNSRISSVGLGTNGHDLTKEAVPPADGLTVLFEIGLGRLVLGLPWERITEDYNPARGGFLGFGLLFVAVSPLLGARLRGKSGETKKIDAPA